MVQWLLSLPKTLLVILSLTVAIIVIVAQDPPHTLCRTQVNNFKSRQKGKIYKDPEIKHRKKALIKILVEHCKKGNSPGNCYGLFSKTKELIHDFQVVSASCRSELSSLTEVRATLFQIYNLMIRLAWGAEPVKNHYNKLSWFSVADISLFCSLKEVILTFYGKDALFQMEQKTLKRLPGAKKMNPTAIFELSLVSQNCSIY